MLLCSYLWEHWRPLGPQGHFVQGHVEMADSSRADLIAQISTRWQQKKNIIWKQSACYRRFRRSQQSWLENIWRYLENSSFEHMWCGIDTLFHTLTPGGCSGALFKDTSVLFLLFSFLSQRVQTGSKSPGLGQINSFNSHILELIQGAA